MKSCIICSSCISICVTLCVRVWIEISSSRLLDQVILVTLCVRVWIEIGLSTRILPVQKCHPLREGVD